MEEAGARAAREGVERVERLAKRLDALFSVLPTDVCDELLWALEQVLIAQAIVRPFANSFLTLLAAHDDWESIGRPHK